MELSLTELGEIDKHERCFYFLMGLKEVNYTYGFIFYGSCGAWIGSALHAFGKGYRLLGGAALGLFLLVFYLLIAGVLRLAS